MACNFWSGTMWPLVESGNLLGHSFLRPGVDRVPIFAARNSGGTIPDGPEDKEELLALLREERSDSDFRHI